MTKIASVGDIASKASAAGYSSQIVYGQLGSDTKYCPPYSKVSKIANIQISGSYATNKLVKASAISFKSPSVPTQQRTITFVFNVPYDNTGWQNNMLSINISDSNGSNVFSGEVPNYDDNCSFDRYDNYELIRYVNLTNPSDEYTITITVNYSVSRLSITSNNINLLDISYDYYEGTFTWDDNVTVYVGG